MCFWVDVLVTDVPEMILELEDFDVWKILLEEVDVIDDLAENEMGGKVLCRRGG